MMEKLPSDMMFGDYFVMRDCCVSGFLIYQAPICLSAEKWITRETDIYTLFKENNYKYLIFGTLHGNPIYAVDFHDIGAWRVYDIVKRWP